MQGIPNSFSALFQPARINELIVRNRLVLGPVAAHSPASDGSPSKETVAFFERRARGGVGLIIVGGTVSTADGWNGAGTTRYFLRLDRDEHVPSLLKLTNAVHSHGVPIFAQINVGQGRMARRGPHLIAASPVNVVIPEESLAGILVKPGGVKTSLPREATLQEIRGLEEEAAESAVRMQRAGFDGVEIGAHMSYFIASFLSSRTNRRKDVYGGSIENRSRIVKNIIRMIRDGAGAKFPVGVRMTANEHTTGGQGPEEYAAIAAVLERAGADYFALTDGAYESMNICLGGDGSLIKHGEARCFRKAVSVPVMLQGIHEPAMAANAVRGGDGDLVMLVRPLLADPEFVRKVESGETESIAQCNLDNTCLRRLMLGMPIRCPMNPKLGMESRGSRFPPLGRILSAPVESAALRVASSKTLMGQLAKLFKAPRG